MPETTEPQLTESDIRAIGQEAHYGNGPTLAHVDALIRDWRSMKAEITDYEQTDLVPRTRYNVADAEAREAREMVKSVANKAKAEIERLESENAALREQLAEAESRVVEVERRLRIPFGKFPCAQCGGPHDFDTSVPSVMWNRVIRAKGLPEYLCTTCIVREFVRSGESFTAELWNEEFNGVPVEVVVNGQNAKDAAAIQEENNFLRNQLAQLTSERDEARRKLMRKCTHPNTYPLKEATRRCHDCGAEILL